ncbi:MAG: glycosyltransferase family 2 protein [Nocardioides sp.]
MPGQTTPAAAAQSTRALSAWAGLLSAPHPETRSTAWKARAGALIAIGSLIAYLVWRVTFTMPYGGVNRAAGWALLFVEAVPLLPLITRGFSLWRLDPAAPPRAGLGETYGPVVVFIPTYDEPAAVLGPTVAAACRLQPAHETWVLDDGDRAWVRTMCEEYGARYVSRPEHVHAKAGNINHALELLAAEGNPAEFIAVLDSDHVPLEGFLHQTLGWFDDASIALVQAPQAYFNNGAFDADGFAGEQGVFFHALMVSRSGRRVDPPWCGSTSVVRRSALEQIGGVATDTITEDLHTTIKLLEKEWRTVYHHQILAVGLAPQTPQQYLVQRRRWALGAMQVVVTERLWKRNKWLSLRNQVEYMIAALWWFEGVITAFGVLLPIAVVVSGVAPVRVNAFVYVAAILGQILLRLFGANLLYRGYVRWRHALELRILRIPVGLEAAWWLLTRRQLKFQVTPKGGDAERAESRVPIVLDVLAIIVGSVLVYGVISLFVTLPWHTNRTATLTGGVWLVWAAVLLLLGMARVRSPEFHSTRRVAHRFDVPAIAVVDGHRARLENVSTTGVAVTFEGERPSSAAAVVVTLPGGANATMDLVRADGAYAAYQVDEDDYAGIRALAEWIFLTPPHRDHSVPAGIPAAAMMRSGSARVG